MPAWSSTADPSRVATCGPAALLAAAPAGPFGGFDVKTGAGYLQDRLWAAVLGIPHPVTEAKRISRRIRKQIDEPGLRASIVADVNAVVSTGTASSSSSQHVRVRQGRSSRAGTEPDHKEQS